MSKRIPYFKLDKVAKAQRRRLIFRSLKIKVKPCITWRFIVTFGTAWCITNGWSWVFIGLGSLCQIGWMLTVGLGYQAILWQPWAAEKIVTFAIAIWLHKYLFPNDREMIELLKKRRKNLKDKRTKKRNRDVSQKEE